MIIQETCKLIQNINTLIMAFYHLEKKKKKTIAQIMRYFQQTMVRGCKDGLCMSVKLKLKALNLELKA